MSDRIRITETDLRTFMRDSRYWQAGNPERQAYVGWVTDGFRALYDDEGEAKAGAVWVKPYSRTRDGQVEQVAGHWRSPPPSSGDIIEVQERGSVPPGYGLRLPGPQGPVGRPRTPIEVQRGTNPPSVIEGRPYSGHALDRLQGRGLPPSAIENTVRPEYFVGVNKGAHVYWDPTNRIVVVVNPRTNSVITAMPGSRRPRVDGSAR